MLRLAQLGNDVDRMPLAIQPPSIPPAGADQKIATLLNHVAHPIGLQMGCVANADLPLDHRDAVEPFAFPFIGQLQMPKAFARQVERTMDTPQPVLFPGRASCLGNCRRINDADHASPARRRCRHGQHPPDQQRQPVAALTQPIQQRHIGYIDKSNRGCPCCRRPQASLAQAIREDQTQQIHGGLDLTRAQKGLRFARAGLERLSPAKPGNDAVPILADK